MNKLVTVYWRDIPAQVIGRKGRKTAFKKLLHPRFQKAIDRAAMRAGRGSSDHYLEDWRRESRSCEGDLEMAVNDVAAEFESHYSDDLLDTLARAGGLNKSDAQPEGETRAGSGGEKEPR